MNTKIFKFVFLPAMFTMLLAACNSAPTHVHTYSSDWTYNEEYHWHAATCEHKDEVIVKEAHKFVKGETVAPTKDTKGYTVYTCSVCNYSKNDDYVDPTDPYKSRIKEKDFKVINLSYERQNSNDPRFYDDAKPLSTYLKPDTYKLYYLDEVNDVYYLPLSTYVDLFKGDFKDGVTNTVVEENGISTWTSKYDKYTYTLSLDKNKQTISVIGNIEESFKPVPNGRNGVFEQAKIDISYVEGHEEKVKTFSFKEYGFDIFEVDGKTCYPFALIGAELSKYVERKFINISLYNYLLEFVSSDQYNDFTYLDENNKEIRVNEIMINSYSELYGKEDENGHKIVSAPQALVEFNKKIIYYLFNNYYGLASTRGIKSMSEYFDNTEQSSKSFTSSNGLVRGSGYSYVLQGLNDLHTGYGYSVFMNEGASDGAINDQSFSKDRTNLATLLNALRDQEIDRYNQENDTEISSTNVRYSKDGKYAYFSFDQFNTYTYFNEGTIPESELVADAYFQFVKNLNEIKAKGTVKRVFIDDSINGGGYVAIMGKLLALLSKDNKSVMYIRDECDDSIQQFTTRVDSNNDGVYDANDCYGNDFEFYIVTSSYSFSCGNAFPFYADKNGYAKIIGSQSGGGECCVLNYVLPTGQSITYSSPFHIGQYDKTNNTFEGDESGTFPWLSINKNFNLYNVDSLGAFVTQRKPF